MSETSRADIAPDGERGSWRYQLSRDEKRDLRIDFLRGVAITVMTVNHLGGHSWFNAVTQGRIYASAAEGFILLSGLVLGMLSRQRLARSGWREASARLLERSWTLYKAALTLIVIGVGLTLIRPGLASPSFEHIDHPLWRVALAAVTFHLAPPLIDILQLYVICMILSPPLLRALDRGYWLPALALSWGVWAIHQRHPYALSFDPLERDHPYFAFTSWQLLYVHGFVAGYYREHLQRLWGKLPSIPLTLLQLAAVVALGAVAYYDVKLGMWPETVPERARWLQVTDRSSVGAIRILTLLTLFPLMYTVVDRFWRPLERALGWLLLTLGQSSLYVFLVHIPIVVLFHHIPGIGAAPPWLLTVAHAGVILLLYGMVRRQFLFNIVPR